MEGGQEKAKEEKCHNHTLYTNKKVSKKLATVLKIENKTKQKRTSGAVFPCGPSSCEGMAFPLSGN